MSLSVKLSPREIGRVTRTVQMLQPNNWASVFVLVRDGSKSRDNFFESLKKPGRKPILTEEHQRVIEAFRR